MDLHLAKIRGHFGGTQHSVAVLLQAIEQTLLQSNTPLTPIAYNHAILSTLVSLSTSDHLHQTEIDALYLHAIVFNHLPLPVRRSNSSNILQLIHPRLASLLVSEPDNKVPALKSIIAILLPVYFALSPAQLTQSSSLPHSPAHVFQTALLPLILAHQPKLRRAAQAAVAQIVSSPPAPLASHPYCEPLARFLLAQLAFLLANQRIQPELSLSLLISLVNFSSTLHALLPLDLLESFVACLLGLPKLNNPFLTTAVFSTLEAIFHPATILDPSRIHATLKATILLEPADQKAIPAWLGALEHGSTTLARVAPDLCSAELAQPGLLARFFALFACPAEPVRLAAHSLLVALCRYCLTDADIALAVARASEPASATAAMVALVRDGLGSSQTAAVGGTAMVVGVLKALVQRLGRRSGAARRTVPPGAQLITEHILLLDELRKRGIGLEGPIDQVLACASEVFGPGFLLDVLPLNLDPFDSSDTVQGRAWLLTVLRPFNCSLGEFVERFVPVCERLFERKKVLIKIDKEKIGNNNHDNHKADGGGILLQVKVLETLVEQVWRLFPGYCDLPWDVTIALDKRFSEVLSNLIYTYPNIRPSILTGLKNLIDKTLTLTLTLENNTQNQADSKVVINEFGFNLFEQSDHLKKLAPNFVAVLFNVFCDDDNDHHHNNNGGGGGASRNKGFEGECIGSFLKILDPIELYKTYDKVKSKLDQCLPVTSSISSSSSLPMTKKKSAIPAKSINDTKKMLDVISIILPVLVQISSSGLKADPTRIRTLTEVLTRQELLWSDDGGLQKKVMKLLTALVELVQGRKHVGLIGELEAFLDRVIGGEGVRKVAGAAKRERAQLVLALVGLVPADKMALVPRLLTEVVVGCKEANKDTRLASYDALVLLGRRMMEPGARVDWGMVVGEATEVEMAGAQEGSGEAGVEEFFKMVAAGLAGSSPHMISSTIAALSRVLFEFHDKLSAETVSELMTTMMIFLRTSNREIAKSAIGFMKVCVISLDPTKLEPHLADLVPSLLRWASEHKNYFKTNIQSVVERLRRKIGEEKVEKFVSKDEKDGGRKLWNGVKRRQARSKRKRKMAGRNSEGVGEEESNELASKPVRARLGDAYEEALYGSSDSDSSDCGESLTGKGSGENKKKRVKKNHSRTEEEIENRLVEDGEVEVVDLLVGPRRMANDGILDKQAQVKRRKEALKVAGRAYERDVETGKMVIEEACTGSESEAGSDVDGMKNCTNAYLEAIRASSASGRNGSGSSSGKKKKKRERADGEDGQEDEDDEVVEGINKMGIVVPPSDGKFSTASQIGGGKKIVTSRNGNQTVHGHGNGHGNGNGNGSGRKVKLGQEFKAKKANGDQVLKGGIKPYGYLPLRSLTKKGNSKQNNSGSASGNAGGKKWGGGIDITGKKRGSKS